MLPGADTSAQIAAAENETRRKTIRHISEGVPGAQHHLRHIDHADEQYFRVKALIESMNVLMPGESKRMRAARHRRGAVDALVAEVHEKRAEREKQREADEAVIQGHNQRATAIAHALEVGCGDSDGMGGVRKRSGSTDSNKEVDGRVLVRLAKCRQPNGLPGKSCRCVSSTDEEMWFLHAIIF